MAVINPCGFLQNGGATHTAEQMRNHIGLLTAGKQSSTSLIPRGGVNPALGNTLSVTQTGSPSMAVLVKSGAAVIPGSEGTKQGVYTVLNDGDVTLSIAAAHATLNRIDIVCFKVEDQAYSGSANTSSLVVVTGTPAGSPVAPSPPANSITLAQVSVVALDTSITNGEITDKRTYFAAQGGVITCTSTTRPAANTVTDGQLIYETDTDRVLITHDAGTTWKTVAVPRAYCRVYRNATQSVSHATDTDIVWDAEDSDTLNMANGTSTITIPTGYGGLYVVRCSAAFAGNTTGERFLWLQKNATGALSSGDFEPGTATDTRLMTSLFTELAAGDTIKATMFQNSGGSLNIPAYSGSFPQYATAVTLARVGD